MKNFKISIYWKMLATILASMIVTSSVMGVLYLEVSPRTKLHPNIQSGLLKETTSIAQQISYRLENSSDSLKKVIDDIHQKDNANLIVYNQNGKELASSIEEGLKDTKKISRHILENTLHKGSDIEIIYPNWVLTPIISVPLKLGESETVILQNYYPFWKGVKTTLPRFLPLFISVSILGGFTVLLARYLTRPIRELTKAVKEIGKGKFGAQVEIRSHDEVGQLAQTFNTMSQRLAEMRRSRRELFADISHEIRSPLARILTDVEILMDRVMDASEQDRHWKAICNEVEYLDHMIGDLSTLTRFEQDHVPISLKPSSIKDVITKIVIPLFIPQIEEKGIILKQDISANIPPVHIDPKRITQVISNLITNSLRYTPQGRTIEVGLKKNKDHAEVWVRDTGQGIPEEELPFIFERFYRVDKSRSRLTGGSGLGLAIARQFVEAHGGEIQAKSKLGEGTCITFTLPFPGQG